MLPRKLFIISACVSVLLLASTAWGQGNQRPVDIQIDISAAAGGAFVFGNTGTSSTGVFYLFFGNVNGLGLGAPLPGVTVQVFPNGAIYRTPITITPKVNWGNRTPRPLYISVMLDPIAGNAVGRTAAREGATAATLIAPSTVTPLVFATNATNNAPITRYAGIFVSNANGASSVIGFLSARLLYRVYVQ
ncbi:MAG TPA: hypothetical protein VGC91_02145 [Pyrinomonadaceae bacterium]